MKLMAKNNFIKKNYKRAENFLRHLPVFARYLIVTTSLILVSYLVLTSALVVFLTNHWTHQKKELLIENVTLNAEYSERILASCTTQEELNSALVLICNNLGVSSNAIDADIFFCNTAGKVMICKEDFTYNYSAGSDGCLIHSGYDVPDYVIEDAIKGTYFSDGKIQGLFNEKTFFAGVPVTVGETCIGVIFASAPVESSLKGYANNLARIYLWSAVFAAALTFLAAYAMTAKITNPLRQMSNATKAYAQGDFSKRVTVTGHDEMSELCSSFNQMASALSVLESSRRSFVANVSHELKTPMTTIGGFIDGMLDGTIPPERHDEYLKIVSDEIKRLSRLVTSMLNLSKIEAGELELKPKEFDLTSMMIDCTLTFEQEIEKKSITVEGFENMGNVNIFADRDMLYQVVYNLVDNAVKFTEIGGTISLFAGENQEGKICLAVQNTGDGIASEEIGKIFERFYKVDKSRSYDVKSAGLGLYLCKTIVEMHKGEIFAESVEGEFTRFTVMLPKPKPEKDKTKK